MTASANKGRVVLYYPRLSDTTHNPPAGKDILPIALLSIAAWPHHDGYEVVIIDGNLFDNAEQAHRHVAQACANALVFGVTGIVGFQVADGYSCTQVVRAKAPQAAVIAGGWFASVVPEMYLDSGLFDAVCIGQGELTFRDFVEAIASKSSLQDVPGLLIQLEGERVYTAHRPVVGWDKLLNCPWELIDFEPYRQAQLQAGTGRLVERLPRPRRFKEPRNHVGISYFSSFGCPEPCTFCCSPLVTDQRWKAMPADRMLDDLQDLQERWDFDVIRFLDANWGVAEKRTREFAEGLIEREMDLHWHSMMQAYSLLRYDEGTLDAMQQSGCFLVTVGAETGSESTRESLGKHSLGEDNFRTAQLLDARNINSWLTYVIGMPGESAESMFATVEQASAIRGAVKTAHPGVWPFQPIPGSALYPRALEQGFRPPEDLPGWGEFGEYHLAEPWLGSIPSEVLRRRKLYQHFATLSHGLARGKEGWWEHRAQRRLRTGNWRFARLEAKAFDITYRLSQRLFGVPEPKKAWLESDGQAGSPS